MIDRTRSKSQKWQVFFSNTPPSFPRLGIYSVVSSPPWSSWAISQLSVWLLFSPTQLSVTDSVLSVLSPMQNAWYGLDILEETITETMFFPSQAVC